MKEKGIFLEEMLLDYLVELEGRARGTEEGGINILLVLNQ